jgi:hypothetical protein
MATARERRNFMLMAFHPYGHAACRAVGMVPASVDVAEAEIAIAEKVFQEDLTESELIRLYERAGWYMQAVEDMVAEDVDEYDRNLQEDLVRFYLTMRAEEMHSG